MSWKKCHVNISQGRQILESFKRAFLSLGAPKDMGLFAKAEGDKSETYVLTPAAATLSELLPNSWQEIEQPTSRGWNFSIGDGNHLQKRGLFLD